MTGTTTLFRFLHLPLALGRGAAVLAIVCGAATFCRPGIAAPFFTVTSGSSFLTALESFLWVGPRAPITGEVLLWEGATVGLSEPGLITLEYIGKEALYANNIFRWNGADIFTTGSSNPLVVGQTDETPFPPAALATYVVPGTVPEGTLPFSFFITETAKNVPNDGSNLDIGLWPFPSITTGNPLNFGSSIYLMLDDENTVDADHDDMIVRMSVSAVPEPGTLVLAVFGAGGAAVAALWRRRRGRSRPWRRFSRVFRAVPARARFANYR